MTTNTLVSTVDTLMNAYRSHLFGRALPTPAVVTLYPDTAEISVQAGGGLDLCTRLGTLLVWAYTLAEVTAEWWHTNGGSLHVSIVGRTGGGTSMKVYAGGPFTDCLGLVALARDEREGVSLDELYALLGLLRDAQRDREAA